MNKAAVILASILAIILIAGVFVGGFFAGKGKREIIEVRDTVTKIETYRDTITIVKPVPVKETVHDSILVPVVDTMCIRDTVYISLPMERKEYRDSDYVAVVTGYRPELESISVFPITKVVTQTITIHDKSKPKPWGVGVQVGFGGMYGISSRRVDYGPYIGIGFSYNVIRW